MKRYLLSIAPIVLGILAAAPSAASNALEAAHAVQPPSVVVRYSELNLARRDGAEVLYRRIQAAASRVCPALDKLLYSRQAHRECVAGSVDRAVQTVAAPMLDRVHASSKQDRRGTVSLIAMKH